MTPLIEWRIDGDRYHAECRVIPMDGTQDNRPTQEGLRQIFGWFDAKDDAELLDRIGKIIQLKGYLPLAGEAIIEEVRTIDSRWHRISFRSIGEVKRIST